MNAHPDVNLITAVPTLFDEHRALDLGACAAAYTQLAAHDVDGVFVAGTTGEFTTLTDEERLDVSSCAAEAFGPERTYWHVGAASLHQAVPLTDAAVARGARHLAAVTPHYFAATESAVLSYYETLVRRAGDVPLYAYLFAARATTTVSPGLLAKVAQTGIAGVKISGEPHEEVRRYIDALGSEGPLVYSGADGDFLEVVTAGGAGVVSGVSSALPQPFLDLRDALRAGDEAAVETARGRARRAIEATAHGNVPHLKAVLELRGIPASTLRAPMDPVTPAQRATLEADVADLL
jgi:4-hydroxy-tetrahydrodipicolinate synthase